MYTNQAQWLLVSLVGMSLAASACMPPSSIAAHAPSATAGGVSQQAQWAPVNDAPAPILVAGVRYDEQIAPIQDTAEAWYWIPDWFAGTWKRDSVTTTSTYNYKTCSESTLTVQEMAQSNDGEGWQKDNRGTIWNCDHTPFRSESDCGNEKQIFVVTAMKPLEISEEKVVKQFEGTGCVVDKATGKIRHCAKATSVQTYRKVGPGVMEASSVTTELSADGEPLTASKSMTTYRQTADFHARDFHGGKDMRVSFKNYLDSHGKPDLAPTAVSLLP